MRNLLLALFIILSILGSTCHWEQKDKFYEIEEKLTAIIGNENWRNKKFVLIIPRAGCAGCITNAMYLVNENKDKVVDNGIVVFTEVIDIKLLRYRLQRSLLNDPNVIIDTDGFFSTTEIQSIYPMIYYLNENGSIDTKESFDNGFQLLD